MTGQRLPFSMLTILFGINLNACARAPGIPQPTGFQAESQVREEEPFPTPEPIAVDDDLEAENDSPTTVEEPAESIDAPEEQLPPPPPPPPPAPVTCANGKKNTATVTVPFTARQGCSFGVAPNLTAFDGFVRAREQQTAVVVLPPNSLICSFKVSTDKAAYSYSDSAVLTLDQHVLMTSTNDMKNFLTASANTLLFDFAKILNQDLIENAAVPFCVGGGECLVPRKTAAGPLKFNIEAGLITGMLDKLSAATSVRLNLIHTGDNNSIDCGHNGVDLQVTIESVTK